MITNFEELTQELSDEEKLLVPVLVKGFEKKTKLNPVKAPEIIKQINANKDKYGLKKNFTEVRLRKLCNFLRTRSVIPLIATSDGYYVSYDREEIQKQVNSLTERADAIMRSADGLKEFLK